MVYELDIMDKSKNILVLPGSLWQVPIAKKIKAMGYNVIAVNPYKDSPVFACADISIQSDIFKQENYLEQVRELKPVAVVSDECDIATELVAELAEKFGVRSQTIPMAQLYTNKVKMREFLREHNLPYPSFQICYTLKDALDFFRELNKPMVIKPIDSNSSHGVFTIHNENELRTHFDEALSFSRTDKAVICEQYIVGTEFTVDGIKTETGHTCLAISEKKHYTYNENIAYELFFSHENPHYDYNRLREINDRYVELSGLAFGLTHAEYKYEDGEFYLIEIGARGGGNLISADIVPCMSGYDNYEAFIKMALGEGVQRQPRVDETLWSRCAVLEFFDAPGKGGIVTRIEGEDFLKNNSQILSYKLNFKIGDRILPAKSDAARIGFYIAYADNRDELLRLMEEIQEKVKFIY